MLKRKHQHETLKLRKRKSRKVMVIIEAIGVVLAGVAIIGGLVGWISNRISKQEVLFLRVTNLEKAVSDQGRKISVIEKLLHRIAGKLAVDTKGIDSDK